MANSQVREVKDQADVRMSIDLPVSGVEYAYLQANSGGKPPSEKLAAFTKWFLTRQAAGGLMIEPADMDYLANLNKGQRFEASRDVVKAVEVALKREEGQYSFTINIDPTLVQALEECANWQGVQPRELVDIVINQALQNGWAYEFTPANGRLVPMEAATVDLAKRMTGKVAFDGGDLAKLLARLEELEKAQPKAEVTMAA